MQFIASNYEDIARYYRNTFVKFRETGDTLYYIRSVSSYSIRGTDENGTEFELFLNDEVPYELDYVLPRKSFFQYRGQACLLQRIPAKQYQRGVSENNVRLQLIQKKGTVQTIDLGFEALKAFVSKPAFPRLDDAVANKEGNNSVVLSPRFAYAPAIKTIYADLVPVATIVGKAVRVSHKIFAPELAKIAESSSFSLE
jgi:hypothetical protein